MVASFQAPLLPESVESESLNHYMTPAHLLLYLRWRRSGLCHGAKATAFRSTYSAPTRHGIEIRLRALNKKGHPVSNLSYI